MLNIITLMGRLTRDPELRHTQSGLPVASFTVACERDYGEREQKETDFIDIVAWRSTAEFAAKYFTKGQLVAVTGRLQLRDWTDADGHKRRNAEVVADRVYFAESKRDKANGNDSTERYSIPRSTEPYTTPVQSGFEDYEDDDDLPF